MTSLFKADIFFFISSASVVVLTIALIIVLAYAFMAIRDARALIRSVRAEVESFAAMRRRVRYYARFATKLPRIVRRGLRR
ncbi:MAG TPA: hypothetical protein VFL98_01815 [Candidatus Paceibacterota bacterium]|nr:hypothetical protein [Candidatus Paceibacterota bacterium]